MPRPYNRYRRFATHTFSVGAHPRWNRGFIARNHAWHDPRPAGVAVAGFLLACTTPGARTRGSNRDCLPGLVQDLPEFESLPEGKELRCRRCECLLWSVWSWQ